jgi:hypothetical protein
MRSYTVIVFKATCLSCSLSDLCSSCVHDQAEAKLRDWGFQEVLVSEAGNCKTIVDHSWIVIALRFGWHTMKASQEPLEETKVGERRLGDGGAIRPCRANPSKSQDTLGRKLLKACAGSNPTWIGAPSFFHALVRFLCPHENGQNSVLQGKHL